MRRPSPFRSLLVTSALAFAALAFADQNALQADPLQRLVTYRIYEDPYSLGGPIDYEITLSLAEQERDDHDIRWSVEAVTVRRPGGDGEEDIVWKDAAPVVDTSSGDWWVTHEDPNNPINEDFVLPPGISGTAADQAGLVADLDYSVAGEESAPPGSIPGTDTAVALDWRFTLAGEPTPLDEGEDEPVELPPVILPPTGN